jgi:hypothetical protein
MYEKFGFTYDQTMFSVAKGIECFNDRDNLPMLIDFYTKPGYAQLDKNGKNRKIVDILIGSDKGYPKSKICGVRGNYQRLLGMIKSIKLYIDNVPGSSLADFVGNEGVILHKIRFMHVNPNLAGRSASSRSAATPPAIEGTIDEVINYLENPPVPDDLTMKAKIDHIITFLPKEKKKPSRVATTTAPTTTSTTTSSSSSASASASAPTSQPVIIGGRSSRKLRRKISRRYTKKRN